MWSKSCWVRPENCFFYLFFSIILATQKSAARPNRNFCVYQLESDDLRELLVCKNRSELQRLDSSATRCQKRTNILFNPTTWALPTPDTTNTSTDRRWTQSNPKTPPNGKSNIYLGKSVRALEKKIFLYRLGTQETLLSRSHHMNVTVLNLKYNTYMYYWCFPLPPKKYIVSIIWLFW